MLWLRRRCRISMRRTTLRENVDASVKKNSTAVQSRPPLPWRTINRPDAVQPTGSISLSCARQPVSRKLNWLAFWACLNPTSRSGSRAKSRRDRTCCRPWRRPSGFALKSYSTLRRPDELQRRKRMVQLEGCGRFSIAYQSCRVGNRKRLLSSSRLSLLSTSRTGRVSVSEAAIAESRMAICSTVHSEDIK